jgi:hypothetical protein
MVFMARGKMRLEKTEKVMKRPGWKIAANKDIAAGRMCQMEKMMIRPLTK